MEFNEKLQDLRKSKGLTQEELAEKLYVSRTAVSKWESGKGYPNIDSLKAIANFFSVSVDQLLSGDQILTIAKEEHSQKQSHFLDLLFGIFDVCFVLFFFLPLFRKDMGDAVQAVSLLSLAENGGYLAWIYGINIAVTSILGVLTLALQNNQQKIWMHIKRSLSLLLNGIATILFIISMQPYAAVMTFVFLGIKVIILAKKQ